MSDRPTSSRTPPAPPNSNVNANSNVNSGASSGNTLEYSSGSSLCHTELSKEQVAQLQELLQRYWGYTEFRAFQVQAMAACLAKRDSLTILPTGAGKSICYQLPAVASSGTALVVSPLIALMKDQVDALRKRGIAAAFVNSSLTSHEREKVMTQMSEGKLKLLYIAPERLMLENTLRYIARQKISFIAIDEAHCISNWGHDFRPDYRKLGELKSRLSGLSIHCFTATASPKVQDDIVVQLKLRDAQRSVADMDRPNLMYRMIPAIQRLEQICQIIDHYPRQSGIVFCMSRKETERLAADLRHRGYNAAAYHAGFDMLERKRVQERFIRGQTDIIVATIAFGMGIDKPNIRFVIHNSLPQSVEHYLQECGRAGRDGLPSECVILYAGADRFKRIALTESEPSSRIETVQLEVHRMANFASGSGCRRKALLASMGQQFAFSQCGACDNCLNHSPIAVNSEAVIIALLRVVDEMGGGVGSKRLRQIAREAAHKKILKAGVLQSNPFEVLQRFGDVELEDYLEQMVSLGLLACEKIYCLLVLTPQGKKALQSQKCSLKLLDRFARPSPIQLGNWNPAADCDVELFRICLKKLSSERANSGTQHLDVIGSQSTNRNLLPASSAWQLASQRPTDVTVWREWFSSFAPGSAEVLERSDEIGEQYAQRICDWMREYCERRSLVTNQNQWREFVSSLPAETEVAEKGAQLRLNASTLRSFPYFDSGLSIAEVASASGLGAGTITSHLCKYIEARNITDCSSWIAGETIGLIEEAIGVVGNERMRLIFDHLEAKCSYDDIRIVLTTYNQRQQNGSLLSAAQPDTTS